LRHLVLFAAIFPAIAPAFRRRTSLTHPTPQIAQRVGEWAEYYRREKAILWLGKEMPTWGQPCPLKVTVTYNGSGGATSFAFDRGRILSIDMNIEGTLDRLVASVLPHEVTHTVFAYHFRCPVPRWADEGGSVLSEDEQERNRHDGLVRQILKSPGRAILLRRLFSLKEYPSDVMCLYAQGYSVANFLVQSSNRATFLNSSTPTRDRAVQTQYRYQSAYTRTGGWSTSGAATPAAAQPLRTRSRASRTVTRPDVEVWQTVPPGAAARQRSPRPIVRGARPDEEQPRYLPETNRPPATLSAPVPMSQQDRWVPSESRPSSVRLGAPEYVPQPPPPSRPPVYQTPGYPN
jgi:hypothetical protein